MTTQLEAQDVLSNVERAIREATDEIDGNWSQIGGGNAPATYSGGMPIRSRRITSLQDRDNGRYFPYYEHEYQLQSQRAICRQLGTFTAVAVGAMQALQVYVMGGEWDYEAVPKYGEELPAGLIEEVQTVIDELLEKNDFIGCLDNEVHDASREDGDSLVAMYAAPDGICDIRRVDADNLRAPQTSRSLDQWLGTDWRTPSGKPAFNWDFGVLTGYDERMKRIDHARPLGYHVVYDDNGREFDFLPSWPMQSGDLADRCGHLVKRNTPAAAKRGISDYFPVVTDLEREDKLNTNLSVGAAALAAIAWIEVMPAGTTRDQAEGSLSNAIDDFSRALAMNKKPGDTRMIQNLRPGSVPKVSAGREYQAGPLGQGRSPIYIAVRQAIVRRIESRWLMPEYMISADACFSEDTEILTADGWKSIDQFGPDEAVATHCLESGELQYQRPLRIYASQRDGDMVRLLTSRVDVLVTPNHGIIASRHLWQRREWHRVQAADLGNLGSQFFLPSNSEWTDGEIVSDQVSVPGLGKTIDQACWFKFLGIYIGDGSVSGNRVCVGGISRPHKLEEYEPVMNELGMKCHIDEGGRYHWYVDNRDFAMFLAESCGKGCENKHLPNGWHSLAVKSLSPLFAGLTASDGHVNKRGTGRVEYVTTSLRLANEVQHLCVHLSMRSRLSICPPGQLGTLPCYKISCFAHSPDHQLRPVSVKSVAYQGRVWCVEVPNGTVYSRRNGTVSITGNSNANYASTLVAGTPFVKAREGEQGSYKTQFREIIFKGLKFAVDAGRFRRWVTSWQQFKALVDVYITPPPIASEDKKTLIEQQFGIYDRGLMDGNELRIAFRMEPKDELEGKTGDGAPAAGQQPGAAGMFPAAMAAGMMAGRTKQLESLAAKALKDIAARRRLSERIKD